MGHEMLISKKLLQSGHFSFKVDDFSFQIEWTYGRKPLNWFGGIVDFSRAERWVSR